MAFNPDSLFLCCSSNTETVHIFKLEDLKEKPAEDPQGWMGYVGQALQTSAHYLPSQVTEMFKQGRDSALARLPCPGLKNVCAITVIQKLPRLLVASQDGYLYMYNIDPLDGGECTPLKQHRLPPNMDVAGLKCIPIEEIKQAAVRLQGRVLKSPLIRLNMDIPGKNIFLKLENLQPVGSFKLRSAFSAMLSLSPTQLADGVYTASAGNYAQGVALAARELGVPCNVIVPDTAPSKKVAAIEQFGAKIKKVSYEAWWQVMMTHEYPDMPGHFLHPVINRAGIAGTGTIGLEILDDLPQVDAVVMPYGGGSLSTGVASAMKALSPHTTVQVCEVQGAAPLTASRQAGKPTALTDHRTSFVDGMAGKAVFPEMWNLANNLISDVVVLSELQISHAIRLLVESNHIVAEGAGAAPVAATLTERVRDGNIVCVVSGGNIDMDKLVQILEGHVPK